ncbi:hypothetical protein MPH_13505 [Macrophomina phaseolina MS6]|uniref:Uncharacterized protein n=1 Tax=Macrophomina phaseolina (strain MS6) TaxID=1126212 RepID=K2QI22_MACPH|nr:hypothetical protein MPH_13505 [Macrophomina phaseolina MS6]
MTSQQLLPSEHQHKDHLSKEHRDCLDGWNGLLWLSYMSADATAIQTVMDLEEAQAHELEREEELQAEEAAIEQYEEGIDRLDGPIWKDALDPDAVAEEMKAVHHCS